MNKSSYACIYMIKYFSLAKKSFTAAANKTETVLPEIRESKYQLGL